MDTFSRPSLSVAAAALGILALGGFAMGFKGSFNRPGEALPRYAAAPLAPASNLGEPTAAKALVEPIPTSAAAPAAAAPKSAVKPKLQIDTDETDDQATGSPAKPAKSSTPVKITPPPASGAPAASAAPASDAIGDLLPPH